MESDGMGHPREQDSIDVMVRDADFAFVMWNASPQGVLETRGEIERHWPGSCLVVRVQSRSGHRHPIVRTMDVEVSRWKGARYVPMGAGGAVHTFSLGLKGPSKEGMNDIFVPIVRSGPITSPRSRACDAADLQWSVAPSDHSGELR